MSVAQRTKSDVLKSKAVSGLKLYLLDCSGKHPDSLKPKVQEVLNSLQEVAA
jgi:hypothetical protein